jgi:two-component system, chemotaxis family, sensor kinase CheA
VTVGLEDVPPGLLEPVGDILTQLVHNAVRHGIEAPLERVRAGKPSSGTLIVQFRENPARGYELSLQDDGRGLDYAKLRTVAVEKGVLTPDVAAHIDPRKLASLIFRPGFSTAIYGDSTQQNGIGMDLVRERTHDVGGKVGVATRPGEFTRFRIVLPLTAARRVA